MFKSLSSNNLSSNNWKLKKLICLKICNLLLLAIRKPDSIILSYYREIWEWNFACANKDGELILNFIVYKKGK